MSLPGRNHSEVIRAHITYLFFSVTVFGITIKFVVYHKEPLLLLLLYYLRSMTLRRKKTDEFNLYPQVNTNS